MSSWLKLTGLQPAHFNFFNKPFLTSNDTTADATLGRQNKTIHSKAQPFSPLLELLGILVTVPSQALVLS